MQKQLSFFKIHVLEHGGSLAIGKRRSKRPLATDRAIHVTIESENAKRDRMLTEHSQLIKTLSEKWARRFHVTIYRFAVCSNHCHFLLRGKCLRQLQNFFRVLTGQIAQTILRVFPDPKLEGLPANQCKKNQRKFWSYLLYTRVLWWGRDFDNVDGYIEQNRLEALHLIAYKPRNKRRRGRKRKPSAV